MENIRIVGTSHISQESIKQIKEAFKELNPDIIALELDPLRYQAILSKKRQMDPVKEIKVFGIKGFLLNAILAYLQKKLGKKVKIEPGSDMLVGIELAKKNKKDIALIDQDIRITIRNLSNISKKEKIRILKDLIRAIFTKKQEFAIDLKKVPEEEFIDEILTQVKERYPGVYKSLIDDRNKILAKNLNKLKKENNKKILVIIGAGHKKEVERIIKNET